jgi:hypothetical protein
LKIKENQINKIKKKKKKKEEERGGVQFNAWKLELKRFVEGKLSSLN